MMYPHVLRTMIVFCTYFYLIFTYPEVYISISILWMLTLKLNKPQRNFFFPFYYISRAFKGNRFIVRFIFHSYSFGVNFRSLLLLKTVYDFLQLTINLRGDTLRLYEYSIPPKAFTHGLPSMDNSA